MMKAGTMTNKNGNMGLIIDVPATVLPFLPIPPFLNTVAKLNSTKIVVKPVNDTINNHNSTLPITRVDQRSGPNMEDITWINIIHS